MRNHGCVVFFFFFFFFKQKTAYEIMPSLVGSEMCIRDSCSNMSLNQLNHLILRRIFHYLAYLPYHSLRLQTCLLYTSDAADDMQCVDLGGRRIIKKKKKIKKEDQRIMIKSTSNKSVIQLAL
eukprot:TRINITY_DN697_c0_g1_i5.p1 TRINITY_DN697_c0_g1~~TRINITY_DN697_c0_g1_i5.p1  ORF type:complete len:123 (+),score=23.89 TRINITY_DN697_c0_g1_i5:39-407(+)